MKIRCPLGGSDASPLGVLLCVVAAADMASAGEMYRFAISRDHLAGPPACELNSPIRPKDRIHVKNGHFYTAGKDGRPNTADDKRARLWGVNLSAPLTFPRTTAEAERLASRLEKLGVNIVRLHSFDGSKNKPDYMAIIDTKAHYPLLNETNMKCLDRLLKAFGDHGIYAHFALHVAYTFDTKDYYTDALGEHRVPDPAKTTKRYPKALPMPGCSKPLLMFNREMIELQKRFVAAILSRKNHLTGVRYADDPVVATLELNNEASLIETFHARTETLPPLYAEELDAMWREWLRAKYGNDKSLSRAWEVRGARAKDPGLINGCFEDAPGSKPSGWTLYRFADAWPPGGARQRKVKDWGTYRVNRQHALEVAVSKVPPTYWHIFVAQGGLRLSEGRVYTIRFKAWADSPRTIQVSCQGGPRMSGQAFHKRKIAITAKPTFYAVTFTSMLSGTNCRLNIIPLSSGHPFTPGDNAGRLWIDDVSMTCVKPYGLRPDESLTSYVERPVLGRNQHGYPSPARRKDYLRFLNDTERKYYREMQTYIREAIGAKQPVTGSQSNYGGLLGHKNMADLMDFVDLHFYYDHCTFPRPPRQAKWTYKNVPMVENPSESIVAGITQASTEGKPFTITEYGPNPFNQYMIEGYTITPAYAALQDMDAVFLFQYFRGYKDCRDDVNPDQLTGVHNVLGDTRAEALMNLAARLFRRGLVRPAHHVIRIPINDEQCFAQVYKGRNLRSLRTWLENPEAVRDEAGSGFDSRMGLISQIRLRHTDQTLRGCFPHMPARERDPQTGEERTVFVSDTGQLRWVYYGKRGRSYFTLDTERAKLAVGYLKRRIQLHGVAITGVGDEGQFGLAAMVSMDGKPVTESSDIFVLSLGGKGKSHNLCVVQVDPAKKRYRLVGPQGRPFYIKEAGPFEIESNPVSIALSSSAPSMSIERLRPDGSALSRKDVAKQKGEFVFTVGRAVDRTPWYRVVAGQNK